jgi:hypothetical protein
MKLDSKLEVDRKVDSKMEPIGENNRLDLPRDRRSCRHGVHHHGSPAQGEGQTASMRFGFILRQSAREPPSLLGQAPIESSFEELEAIVPKEKIVAHDKGR